MYNAGHNKGNIMIEAKEEIGIQNILDIHKVSHNVTVGLVKIFKDGWQSTDLAALMTLTLGELENIKEMVKDISEVPSEAKDIDEQEAAQLSGAAIGTVFAIVKALK